MGRRRNNGCIDDKRRFIWGIWTATCWFFLFNFGREDVSSCLSDVSRLWCLSAGDDGLRLSLSIRAVVLVASPSKISGLKRMPDEESAADWKSYNGSDFIAAWSSSVSRMARSINAGRSSWSCREGLFWRSRIKPLSGCTSKCYLILEYFQESLRKPDLGEIGEFLLLRKNMGFNEELYFEIALFNGGARMVEPSESSLVGNHRSRVHSGLGPTLFRFSLNCVLNIPPHRF